MKPHYLAAVCALSLAYANSAELFNGKDLTGWVKKGGDASYTIEGDEIVGTSKMATANTFLCTEKTYGNFTLEYDFKVDPKLNSGVQIRSECLDAPKQVEWKGQKIEIPAGRVHGYQVEIDPDMGRAWSGGIFDEARRKWLYPGALGGDAKSFTKQGKELFKQSDWNHIRVEAQGDSIKTWLNGTTCADISDSMTPRGFIALQVHTILQDQSKDGTQVRWRNLKITEAGGVANTTPHNTLSAEEKSAGWKLLWDGKTSTGWSSAKSDHFPAKGWEMKDGVLTIQASAGTESAAFGDIITDATYSQFELTADFKITEGANSGIKYFVQPDLKSINSSGKQTATGSSIGLEFQILDDAHHPDAKLGHDGDRTIGSLYDLIPAAKGKVVNPIGEWNSARILVKGSHVEHWLNGKKTLEYERGTSEFRAMVVASKYHSIPGFGEWPEGHILLQDHGNQVSYRNIKIRIPVAE